MPPLSLESSAVNLALLLVLAAAPAPQSCVPAFTKAQARGIIADARRIVTPNGVEELLELPIGGTKQWISVRGRDRRNPVLLMIHGGPASPEMPTSWAFQAGWEDYFTVVQWDQRGSGKSYTANDPAMIAPTLSLERITQDAAEVVQALRKRYGKEKIFVLGHSWGSLVGLGLAHKHPGWLHAYVGMGQVINGQESERTGYAITLRAAEAARNDEAIRELKSIAPYPEKDGTLPLEKIGLERKWSVRLGGLSHRRDNLGYYLNQAELSPDYSDEDVAAIDKGAELSVPRLLPDLGKFNYTNVLDFRCPILMFAGRHDFTTPSELTAAWLQKVRAPKKKLIWFENSGHMAMVEEPGRMLVHLVQDVRPLAGKAELDEAAKSPGTPRG
ncbi:alpha/beta fold hydrolase [Archangium minus]|uniref:alpha/beta fold hydrolase n=1 Tax=Archangium minus TaxID=83450 RepID=UPI0037BEA460